MLDSEKVKELICMDEINVSEEEEVYQAVIAWVKHDLSSRECLLPELLKCVRLFSMSKYNLRKILDEEIVSKNPTCMRKVINAIDFFLFPARFPKISLKPRLSLDKYEHVVVLTGGETGSGSKQDNQCFIPSTMTWGSLPMIPCSRTHHGAAVCGGLLYILGGGEKNSLLCFDPKLNTWSSHDIALNPKDCSVICFNEELYVIGGEDSWHDVQIYNPIVDKWRQAAPMEIRRAGHSAVVLQDHIYVIAGHNGEVCLNSVECYNPLTDQWTPISSISKVRRFAAATTAGEKIVVFGGFGDMTNTNIDSSCEIYDPSTKKWSLVSSSGFYRAAGSAVNIDDKIYLFGGEDESAYLSEVECFDKIGHKWHEISPIMLKPRSFLQATLLKLPKKFIKVTDNTTTD